LARSLKEKNVHLPKGKDRESIWGAFEKTVTWEYEERGEEGNFCVLQVRKKEGVERSKTAILETNSAGGGAREGGTFFPPRGEKKGHSAEASRGIFRNANSDKRKNKPTKARFPRWDGGVRKPIMESRGIYLGEGVRATLGVPGQNTTGDRRGGEREVGTLWKKRLLRKFQKTSSPIIKSPGGGGGGERCGGNYQAPIEGQ